MGIKWQAMMGFNSEVCSDANRALHSLENFRMFRTGHPIPLKGHMLGKPPIVHRIRGFTDHLNGCQQKN
jgi:hypothetical protein